MPTENWYTASTATTGLPAGHDDYTNAGGANKNASVQVGGGRAGPATHDDDTSYIVITASAPPHEQALNADWPGPVASLSAFTAGSRQRGANVGAFSKKARFVNASGTGGSAFYDSADGTQTYVTQGPIDVNSASYRPGGGAWNAADFANSTTIFPEAFVDSNGSNVSRCTSIWGAITYIPPSGGFAFLLGLAGLMSLQLAGPMTDYTQFEKFLQWRHDYHPRHTILTADEKIQSWDEYKSYRAPRFFYG